MMDAICATAVATNVNPDVTSRLGPRGDDSEQRELVGHVLLIVLTYPRSPVVVHKRTRSLANAAIDKFQLTYPR